MRRLTRERLSEILTSARTGHEARALDDYTITKLAGEILEELETERSQGEPIFASVSCDEKGVPQLNCFDELAVADLGWFENVPKAIKGLMSALDVDEWVIIRGQFYGFENEWNTNQLIKRVL